MAESQRRVLAVIYFYFYHKQHRVLQLESLPSPSPGCIDLALLECPHRGKAFSRKHKGWEQNPLPASTQGAWGKLQTRPQGSMSKCLAGKDLGEPRGKTQMGFEVGAQDTRKPNPLKLRKGCSLEQGLGVGGKHGPLKAPRVPSI